MKSLQQFKQLPSVELDEGVVASSDYKLGPSGKKVRAHRLVMATQDEKQDDEQQVKEETEVVQEQMSGDLPFVLVLKRKAFRLYPNGMKVALYYNDKLGKYFSVPYTTEKDVNLPIQAEEYDEHNEQLEEGVMDQLHKIVKEKQHNTVKFANGKSMKVDHFTASAITQVHNALNDENKKKLSDMIHKSPEHFHKVAGFAFSKVK